MEAGGTLSVAGLLSLSSKVLNLRSCVSGDPNCVGISSS